MNVLFSRVGLWGYQDIRNQYQNALIIQVRFLYQYCTRMLYSYPGKRLNPEIVTLTLMQKPTLSRKHHYKRILICALQNFYNVL